MGHSVGVQVAMKAVCFEPKVSTGAEKAIEGKSARAPKRAVWTIIFVILYLRWNCDVEC